MSVIGILLIWAFFLALFFCFIQGIYKDDDDDIDKFGW